MKYCCTNSERQGSCYFEFQSGRFSENFWRDDSLYLSGDDFDALGLYEVAKEARQAVEEIHQWARLAFRRERVLTVLGI